MEKRKDMATKRDRAAELTSVTDLCSIADGEARRRASLEPRFAGFSKDYPQLLAMVVAEGPDFDVSHLRFMLGQLDEVHDGVRSVDDAQKLLFERLNGEFVDPLEQAKAAQ